MREQLPFHQTHAIKVNAVENKKAHVGVLKGGFLGGHGTGQELELWYLKIKNGAKLLEKATQPAGINLVDSQGPEGQRFAGLCVDQEHFSVQYHTVASREGLGDVVLEMRYLKHRRVALKILILKKINKGETA